MGLSTKAEGFLDACSTS